MAPSYKIRMEATLVRIKKFFAVFLAAAIVMSFAPFDRSDTQKKTEKGVRQGQQTGKIKADMLKCACLLFVCVELRVFAEGSCTLPDRP